MENQSTDRIELASRFVNSTSSHIFLTGKAGTGKTTFLRNLAESTHKNFVIVAPTGVAALNAGGVTIHSQFLFPFGTFLVNSAQFPEFPGGNFFDQNQLARRNPLNSARKQVLRNIDLLVIDEVSMVRADQMDALDYRMKSAKGNFKQPFGGVQLLVIGDLFQLPPIVKNHEWEVLKSIYSSMHFFESLAWKKSNFVYIELDKVFRQREDRFIEILNHFRNNQVTAEDLELLNSRYVKEIPDKDMITITTHNHIVDKLNRQELAKLPGKSHFYEAGIEGDFPENMYPLSKKLELKVGARVMFIKNDPEGKAFYNGKLAKVKKLSEDNIVLKMEDGEIELKKYTWENKKYRLNPSSKEIEEDIIGSFSHYPIKHAWAITVHKSQGLTFEKAVIDVGNAFASGQVYVALSRLQSLDGLFLRTPVSASVVSSDEDVVNFSTSRPLPTTLNERLKTDQKDFVQNYLYRTFDFSTIISQIAYTQQKTAGKAEFEDEEMRTALKKLKEKIEKEKQVTVKFKDQLGRLIETGDQEKLLSRIEKGSTYYLKFLFSQLKELLIHIEEVKQFSRTKTYLNLLDEMDQLLVKKIEQIQKATYLCRCILNEEKIERKLEFVTARKQERKRILEEVREHIKQNPKTHLTKTGKKRKQSAKGETFEKTFALFKEGKTVAEIAEKRGFAISTIEGHLARGVQLGELEIKDIMEEKELQEIATFFDNKPVSGLKEIFEATNKKYSYGKLRMVQAEMQRKLEKEKV